MKHNNNTAVHILHIPKWYPSRIDPQLGIFIQKQIRSTNVSFNNSVIYTQKQSDLKQDFDPEVRFENNILEVIIYYKSSQASLMPFQRFINFIRYLKAFRKGLRIIKNKRGIPGLIHVHVLMRTALWAFWWKWILEVPYTISEHWSGYITGAYKNKSAVYKIILKKIIKNSAAITAVSEKLKESMISNGLSHSYFYVVPNIVDPPVKKIAQKDEEKSELIILTIADLVDEVKNISGILRSLSETRKELGSFQYHIVGDGPDRDYLELLAQELNFNKEQIIFHGKKSNKYVYGLMYEVDFLIVNSNVESFSVVTLEALIHGKPVIATKCGGPEQFINENNGILIGTQNQIELQNALINMKRKLSEYDAERIAASVSEMFSSRKVGEQLHKIYEKFLMNENKKLKHIN